MIEATLIAGDGIGAAVLNEDGVRTGDLGGRAATSDFTQAVIRRLGA